VWRGNGHSTFAEIAALTLGIGNRRSKAYVFRFPVVWRTYLASSGFTRFILDDAASLCHKRIYFVVCWR